MIVGRILIINIVLIFLNTVCAQQNYEMTKLSDNLYQFYQKDFVNMFAFVSEEGILLVDSGFDEIAESVKEELAGITDKGIKYIINTHSDYDHLAGNKRLRGDAIVIAHYNCKTDLVEYAKPNHPNPFDRNLFTSAMPDITFDEKMEIFFGNGRIKLFQAIGGHTTSDIVIYLKKENIAFIGDIFFTGSFPHVKERIGTNIDNLLKAIDIILKELPHDVVILVGHGDTTNMDMVKGFKDMVEITTAIVKAEIENGRTLDEIKNDNVLKDWTGWSKTVFEEVDCNMWIETIYNNYKK